MSRSLTLARPLTLAPMLLAAALLAPPVAADEIEVTIENTMPAGGFFFTPFWIAAHDGSFDTYDAGSFAQGWTGLTELAENGNTGPLSAAFAASPAGMAGGRDATIIADAFGPPVFNPGESATALFDVGEASINRYFSFASMVIPSNDLFIGNDGPMAHELFDASGTFLGPVTIDIYGIDVRDNGTEINDAHGDAAFSLLDGQSRPEFAVIATFFDDPDATTYLGSFLGTETASGDLIGSAFTPADHIARITIVPAPGAAAAFLLLGLAPRRRRA